MAWKFYVYEILRGDSVVYVGKGCGNRVKQSERDRDGSGQIIAYFKSESDAFAFEKDRIKQRLQEGVRLLNISHGVAVAWHRRTDTRQMAAEVLQDIANKFGTWIRGGKVAELSAKTRIPESMIFSVHQRFGA